jgi:hypothetical protein
MGKNKDFRRAYRLAERLESLPFKRMEGISLSLRYLKRLGQNSLSIAHRDPLQGLEGSLQNPGKSRGKGRPDPREVSLGEKVSLGRSGGEKMEDLGGVVKSAKVVNWHGYFAHGYGMNQIRGLPCCCSAGFHTPHFP